MKAYRVYFIDHSNRKARKVYKCNSPGCWSHHCEDPEYAVPYLDKEKAEESAASDKLYVSPSGEKRYVEEYEETRPLVVNKYDGDVTFAEFMPYYTHRSCYIPA